MKPLPWGLAIWASTGSIWAANEENKVKDLLSCKTQEPNDKVSLDLIVEFLSWGKTVNKLIGFKADWI